MSLTGVWPKRRCNTRPNIKGRIARGTTPKTDCHWVDNFHTAYVLDCFKHYVAGTGDDRFDRRWMRGYEYWKKTFFLADGTPRYYHHKTLPLDIQCSSQAIDTLVFFRDRDPEKFGSGGEGRAVDD